MMESIMSLLDMEDLSLFKEREEKGGVFGETGEVDFGFVDGGDGNDNPIFELIAGTEDNASHQHSCDLPSDPILEDWMENMDLKTLLADALDETEELLADGLCDITCDVLETEVTAVEGHKNEMPPECLTLNVACLNDSGIDISLQSSPEPPSPESSSSVFDSSRSSSPSTVASSSLEELLLADSPSLDVQLGDTALKASRVKSKRSKPYSRTEKSKSGRKDTDDNLIDDTLPLEFLSKKDRKKIQNKNAAIRYRQKKKIESNQIFSEMEGLESRNIELNDKVDQLTREIKYMKDLIAEIYKAKGLIKS